MSDENEPVPWDGHGDTDRPEWVTCIARSGQTRAPFVAWCGCEVVGFVFVDVDHAARSTSSRLQACRECVAKVERELAAVKWDGTR